MKRRPKTTFHWLRRRDSIALVNGTAAAPAGYEAVADFVDALRHDAATMPAPVPRPRLAATLDGRRPLRTASDPVPRQVRAPLSTHIRALRPATIAIASGAVFFGRLATAGALPGPLQHASANLTEHVGVHLPGATPAPKPSPRPSADTGGAHVGTEPNSATSTPAATRGGTTTTGSPRRSTTPSTANAPKSPTTGKGSAPVTIPVTVPNTVPVTLPGEKPPVVVTLPSLPIQLPGLPTTIPIPRRHER